MDKDSNAKSVNWLVTLGVITACVAIVIVILMIPIDGLAVDSVYEAF